MHYLQYGIKIELITDQSSESFQFVKGFGGIGGFLRYKLELDDIIGDAAGQYDDFDPDEPQTLADFTADFDQQIEESFQALN